MQYRSLIGLAIFSAAVTGAGVWVAYQVELVLLPIITPRLWILLAGFLEEAFVRLLPLILVFYAWSYHRGGLLSKTEGLLAATISGLTVSALELIFKLQYLTRLERTVHFDALVAPIVFIHLPLTLVAGRFAYALGEQIHGRQNIGLPRASRRALGYLLVGYLILAGIHVTYNAII